MIDIPHASLLVPLAVLRKVELQGVVFALRLGNTDTQTNGVVVPHIDGNRHRLDSPAGPILWSGEVVLDRTAFENAMEEMLSAAGEPVIESDMNVHVHGRRIFYVSDDCRNTDGRTPFLLHVTPTRAADLAQERIEHGYDNLDFHQVGATVGARCVVRWRLPDYPIRHIRTGQYVEAVDGDGEDELLLLWEGETDIVG